MFDNLCQGHRAAVHPNAIFVEADLADRASIDRALAKHRPDVVMHFEGPTLVGESMQKPFLYLGQGVRCGLNLLESMIEHGVKRLVLSSTANLFGEPQRIPITEDEQILPGSPYGEMKNILERMLYWIDRVYGMRYVALRYFNAAGATEDYGEDHRPENHLIPTVLQVALGQRKEAVVFGSDYPTPDGTCVRDYIHVSDIAQAHVRAIGALERGSSQYNLGNGAGWSVRQVIDVATRITGRSIPTRLAARRPGDPATLIAVSDKIRRELGWQPRHPDLNDIVESAWRWHQRHPDGYGDR